MRYTLKDYQAEAANDVLALLREAQDKYHRAGVPSWLALSAATGAGKTVIASSVIERLFFGDDVADADPTAVVLWLSDSPDLNRQSMRRIRQASSELDTRLEEVNVGFGHKKLAPNTVYFLNTQKLSKNSRLVAGHRVDPAQGNLLDKPLPDDARNNIWDVIARTIEDEDLTLYLVVDEAHRGMNSSKNVRETKTIVQRMIQGHAHVPEMPAVWGISATLEKFSETMGQSTGRLPLGEVYVDAAKVQESGLLKDSIVLDIPEESGAFDNVLLRRGTEQLRDLTEKWNEYTQSQGLEPVAPLMVVQMPNNSGAEEIGEKMQIINSAWPANGSDAAAHVFGEHTDFHSHGWYIPYVSPELVQDDKYIRVLFAKEAISTGWDCPRAEVLVSFRPAEDRTHITQLLGRFVRTPLARRIPKHDELNSVLCLLPNFNRKTAVEVALALAMGGEEGGGEITPSRVLIDPVDLFPEESDDVWEVFLSLPSETTPKTYTRPVKRLTGLSQAFSDDGIIPGAGKLAHDQLHALLDGKAVEYRQDLEKAIEDIFTVKGSSITIHLGSGFQLGDAGFVEAADEAAVTQSYRVAERAFTKDIARTYTERVAMSAEPEDDLELGEALFQARIRTAALGTLVPVADALEDKADTIANEWLSQHRVAIKGLSDGRQQVYNEFLEMAVEPQRMSLVKPDRWQENTKVLEGEMTTDLPTWDNHLMASEDGIFPADLNTWETYVIDMEMNRPGARAWYRNPDRSNPSSLAISWQDTFDRWKALRPDFLFFHEVNGQVKASIVDPHGHHLTDALWKLRGMARYAESYGSEFHRIEAVVRLDGDAHAMTVLDLTREEVREAIRQCSTAEEAYRKAGSKYR